MIWFLAVPLLALLALLQTAVFRQILFLDGSLDLLLVAIVSWSLLRPEEGLAWAMLAGIFADMFSGGPFGITSIAYLLVAISVGALHGRLWTHSPLAVMATALFGTIIAQLASIAMLVLFGHSLEVGYLLTYVTLPSAFLNTIASVPVYLALRRLHFVGAPALSEEEV
jgi:rod shape-determining protein MreD